MIIQYDDNKSVRLISDTFFGGGKFEATDIPWVKVGKLYMSVCITGENSWSPIAKDMSKNSKVFVFTGRHGEAGGNPVDLNNKIVAKRVYDIKHMKEDNAIVGELVKKGFDVEALDLYEANSARTTDRLRALIKEKIDADYYVILAWCFSFFAMDQFDVSVSKDAAQAIAEKNYDRTVGSMVTNNYSWVKKPW